MRIITVHYLDFSEKMSYYSAGPALGQTESKLGFAISFQELIGTIPQACHVAGSPPPSRKAVAGVPQGRD